MADSPLTTDQFRTSTEGIPDDFIAHELLSNGAGGPSPFGTDRDFPWPIDRIEYTHPGPENRPHLADGR